MLVPSRASLWFRWTLTGTGVREQVCGICSASDHLRLHQTRDAGCGTSRIRGGPAKAFWQSSRKRCKNFRGIYSSKRPPAMSTPGRLLMLPVCVSRDCRDRLPQDEERLFWKGQ